ncbi:MAG: cob(I)yrinic acid a,c-diamide adenosyltransferase [Thermoplasmatota archaeon]
MADDFQDPDIGIWKVYTRGGDKGETSLVGGQRVSKTDARIDAYGTVDELGAIVGLIRAELGSETAQLDAHLTRVQHALFNTGSILATLPGDRGPKQPAVRQADIDNLEHWMDAANDGLPALTSFVLAGGSRLNALLHLARTVCRRAERLAVAMNDGHYDLEVAYLNRLSDAFFVWARWAAAQLGHEEVLWAPNQA